MSPVEWLDRIGAGVVEASVHGTVLLLVACGLARCAGSWVSPAARHAVRWAVAVAFVAPVSIVTFTAPEAWGEFLPFAARGRADESGAPPNDATPRDAAQDDDGAETTPAGPRAGREAEGARLPRDSRKDTPGSERAPRALAGGATGRERARQPAEPAGAPGPFPKERARESPGLTGERNEGAGSVGREGVPWRAWVAGVWIVGLGAASARLLRAHVRTRRAVASSVEIDEPWAKNAMVRAAEAMRARRTPRVFACPGVASPALIGWWRPVIAVPPHIVAGMRCDELAWVFRHELAHQKRGDVLASWVMSIAAAAHWYHPLLRRMVWRARLDRELACDARVTRGLEEGRRVEYGRVLLRVARRVRDEGASGAGTGTESGVGTGTGPARSGAPGFESPGVLGVSSRRGGVTLLERRISMLASGSGRRSSAVVSAALVLVAIVGAVSGLEAEGPRGAPKIDTVATAGAGSPLGQGLGDEGAEAAPHEELELRIYDLSQLPGWTQEWVPIELGLSIPEKRTEKKEAEKKQENEEEESVEEDESEARARRERYREVASIVRETCAPEVWSEGGGQVEVGESGLVVRAPARVHDDVVRLLAELDGDREGRVLIETRVEEVAEGEMAALSPVRLARAARLAALRRPRSAVSLSEEDVREIRAASLRSGEAGMRTAPTVVARSGQRAHTLIVQQAAMIADLRIVKEESAARLEPVVGILSTGVVIGVQAALSESGREMALSLDVETAEERERPRAVRASDDARFAAVDGAEGLFYQEPVLRRARLETTMHIEAGRWYLVGALRSPTDSGRASEAAGARTKEETREGTTGVEARPTTLVLVRATVLRGEESDEPGE